MSFVYFTLVNRLLAFVRDDCGIASRRDMLLSFGDLNLTCNVVYSTLSDYVVTVFHSFL